MTRDELDRLWQQALTAAVKEGEMYTRYHFAALVAEKQKEKDAWVCDTMATVGHEFWSPEDSEIEKNIRVGAVMCAAAIRARK